MIEKLVDVFQRLSTKNEEAASRNPEDARVKRVGYAFVTVNRSSQKNYERPTFNLDSISAAYDTEGYVRQAIDKYVDLIFKAGWRFKGKNEKSLEYVRLRIAMMEEATSIPFNSLLNELGHNFVLYANSILAKARMTKSISGINAQGVSGKRPIGGYFNMAPSTVTIARDQHGEVISYQQVVFAQQKPVTFKPEDIIHITWKRPTGRAFGVPFILPALDDIRLLREIEDNVANLLYKHLHPLYKFIVGLEKDGKESTPEEIDQVAEMIRNMPMDGTLVLPERYDVEVVGAQSEAIDASWALQYFERRVFTDLGVPETVFGRASTANKSTADNLTAEMHDRVKAFQRAIADAINFHMIKEILLEGGFDILQKPEDNVIFEFNEIAIDEKIKLENQEIALWEHNLQTFEEARVNIGRDPIVDESRLHFNMVGTVKDTAEIDNKTQPQNQHGKKLSPKRTSSMTESVLHYSDYRTELVRAYQNLRHDVTESVRTDHLDQIELYFTIAKQQMASVAKTRAAYAFTKGVQKAGKDCGVSRPVDISVEAAVRRLTNLANDDFERLFSDLRHMILVAKDKDKANRITLISASFDCFEYRLQLAARVHPYRAYNYGYALAARSYGRSKLVVDIHFATDECVNKDGWKIDISKSVAISNLPPFHPNCVCTVIVGR